MSNKRLTTVFERGAVSLVDEILLYFTDPCSWPLSDQDRIAFCKLVYHRCLKMKNTSGYHELKVQVAAENLTFHHE